MGGTVEGHATGLGPIFKNRNIRMDREGEIHDGFYLVPKFLKPFINGAANHTIHHLYFDYNYGQYFTLWDRIGGSYLDPDKKINLK